jgi:N-acetylglucosaminyldiphosphoundecaprenol N-acetyl-beta-D-mannosaminyltransferase
LLLLKELKKVPQMALSARLVSSVNVLGVPLAVANVGEMADAVKHICLDGDAPRVSRCISATGAHGLVHAYETPSFHQILNGFYANLPDGRPSVWIGRAKGFDGMHQCPGADFFESLFRTTASSPINHYFCGGNHGVAEKLQLACAQKFSNRQVVGCHTPPFRELSDAELQELAEDINQRNVDILWVGISTPKQEVFAHRIAAHVRAHFIVCVGAAFDFHSGNLQRAPRLVQTLGIEWLYRLLKEPRRLYKRTLTVVPKFIWYNLIEWGRTFTKKNLKGERYE